MTRKLAFFIIVVLFFTANNLTQNLLLYTTLYDASSTTSPSTRPAGTPNDRDFLAAQYNNGCQSNSSNGYITFDIGSTTSTHETIKLNLE